MYIIYYCKKFLLKIKKLLRLIDILRSEEHTSELQSPCNLVCRLLLEKKNTKLSRQKSTRTTPSLPPLNQLFTKNVTRRGLPSTHSSRLVIPNATTPAPHTKAAPAVQ